MDVFPKLLVTASCLLGLYCIFQLFRLFSEARQAELANQAVALKPMHDVRAFYPRAIAAHGITGWWIYSRPFDDGFTSRISRTARTEDEAWLDALKTIKQHEERRSMHR